MSDTALSPRIAIVGAGMAGLACARRLADGGVAVTVFEKSRGLGGRMATRRGDIPAVDHGAQYFRARDARFVEQVEAWRREGAADTWQPRLARFTPQGKVFVADAQPRYVGLETMNAPVRALADGLTVHRQSRVTALERQGDAWRLKDEDGPLPGTFDGVLLALPAPQALPLLEAAPALADRVATITLSPCWAVMAEFKQRLDVDFDAARFDRGAVAWACRNGTKPGRPDGETWVLHAQADWSAGHLEQAPGAIKRVLLDAFFSQIERPTRWPVSLDCHRWRYARVDAPLEAETLYDATAGIGVCGDWVQGRSNVENAYLSGLGLAGRVLSAFG
ncbi:FAD-dependent oxidoreductase [Ectothiorhodospiraceae bacterium WFHF3C12]|nr:FAD-dependent oxidoreductase [Ectothiorhodospiraceae bacterium WFHF3C12]